MDPNWIPRIENRVPRIRENYHQIPRIRENRVPRIIEIGSLRPCPGPTRGGAAGPPSRGPQESRGPWTSKFKIEMGNYAKVFNFI